MHASVVYEERVMTYTDRLTAQAQICLDLLGYNLLGYCICTNVLQPRNVDI